MERRPRKQSSPKRINTQSACKKRRRSTPENESNVASDSDNQLPSPLEPLERRPRKQSSPKFINTQPPCEKRRILTPENESNVASDSDNQLPSPLERLDRQCAYQRIYDFQFFPLELYEIIAKERRIISKQQGYKIPTDSVKNPNVLKMILEEQRLIDEAVELTVEEITTKRELYYQGFTQWTQTDFNKFVSAVAKYGRDNLEDIANEIPDHPLSYVVQYSNTFWEKIGELHNYVDLIKRLEGGEEDRPSLPKRDRKVTQKLLNWKASQYACPITQLAIVYPSEEKDCLFTKDQDRIIICMLQHLGIEKRNVFEIIEIAVSGCPQFQTDSSSDSYCAQNIEERCEVLIQFIRQEHKAYVLSKKARLFEPGVPGTSKSVEEYYKYDENDI